MIFIIDSPKYGKHEALIDDEDWDKIKNFTWCISKKNNCFYVVNRKNGIYLHRLIMDLPVGKVIDHTNNNPLDNRKENLRICSHKENMRNTFKNKNNTSGYKGVFLIKNVNLKKMWFAQIKVNYKSIRLGYYETKDQAAIAYNIAALKYHKEFAKLNNVMEYSHAS